MNFPILESNLQKKQNKKQKKTKIENYSHVNKGSSRNFASDIKRI